MSVEGIRMDDLHQELDRVAHGSGDEHKILEEARQRREHKTDEFRIIRNAGLEAASENGIVHGTEAQHVTKVAIEQVTGEHEIPVEVIEHPGTMH